MKSGEESSAATAHIDSSGITGEEPVGVAVLLGEQLLVDTVNKTYLQVIGKAGHDLAGRPLLEAIPELKEQGIGEILLNVLRTGEPFTGSEFPVKLMRRGELSTAYFNFTYQPLRDASRLVYGVVAIASEVTDYVTARQRLSEEEERSRLAIEAAGIGTFDWDIISDAFIYSPRLAQIFGYGEDKNLLHEDFSELIFMEDRVIRDLAHREARSSGVLGYEARVQWPDGSMHWVRLSGKILFKDGVPYKMHGTAIDITSEKQALQLLEESELRLRRAQEGLEKQVAERTRKLSTRNRELQQQKEFVDAIFDSSGDMIAVFDQEERFISANKRYQEAYGAKEEEIVGKTLTEVFPQVAGQGMHKGLQQALKGEYAHEPVYRSPVTNRYTELFCVPLKDGDRVYAAMAIAHDVTDMLASSESLYDMNRQLEKRNAELAASEDRYHKMIGEVKDYVIIFIDKDGFIRNWNKGAEKIKGYSEQEALGKSFEIFYPAEDRKNNVPGKLREEAIAKGRASSEGWRLRKDGTAFWANVVLTALHDESGALIGFTKVTRDLTERKLADDRLKAYAEELQHKNRELERSNQELVAFSYVASHDLQEPLRKINTFSEQILHKEFDKLSESGKNYFARMQNSITRMQTLIQDLLEYSRINTAARKYEVTDLNLLLQEVRSEFRERLEEKKAVFESDVLPVTGVIPFQLKQLFNNIIGNSIKFSRQDIPLHIRVNYGLVDASLLDENVQKAPKKYHLISISDNGIGFDDQYKNRIFQIFQRLHGKNEYAGTGIGLSICQRVVQNHSGYIRATGEEGRGATFEVYLPANS